VCLGAYGTVVEVLGDARATVRFADGTERLVSLAVLVADGVTVEPGDDVAVAIGMALHRVDLLEDQP
jgi:hydrogenase maturation factor